MNTLRFDKEISIVSLLARGNSVRKAAQLACVHRDTVMRVLRDVGIGCEHLHKQRVIDLESSVIEVDEIWSFIRKKQGRLSAGDPAEWGDQYTFVALDAMSKLVVSYHVGKRQASEAEIFANDLLSRLLVQPQITSDGWRPYIQAFENIFGAAMNHAMLVKMVDILDQLPDVGGGSGQPYSQIQVNEAVRTIITGSPNPSHITTAHVERQNLTIRMDCGRFGRKTLAHSKTLENHKAAMSLHFAYYNFCRIHQSIRVTPAMQTGLETSVWTVADLIQQAKAASLAATTVSNNKVPVSAVVVAASPTKVYGIPPL